MEAPEVWRVEGDFDGFFPLIFGAQPMLRTCLNAIKFHEFVYFPGGYFFHFRAQVPNALKLA